MEPVAKLGRFTPSFIDELLPLLKSPVVAYTEEGKKITMRKLERERTVFCSSPIPVYGEHLTFFIAGPPGCGKSTTTAEILAKHSEWPVYLFTSLEENDRAFEPYKDILEINRMRMETALIKELSENVSLLCEDGDCWVVFDDVDKITDKELHRAVMALEEKILANGRSHGGNAIHVIATSHSLNDYIKTKYLIENCAYWVLFPTATTPNQTKRLLSKLDLKPEQVREYDRIIIHQRKPLFICTPYEISLLI